MSSTCCRRRLFQPGRRRAQATDQWQWQCAGRTPRDGAYALVFSLHPRDRFVLCSAPRLALERPAPGPSPGSFAQIRLLVSRNLNATLASTFTGLRPLGLATIDRWPRVAKASWLFLWGAPTTSAGNHGPREPTLLAAPVASSSLPLPSSSSCQSQEPSRRAGVPPPLQASPHSRSPSRSAPAASFRSL